MRSCAFRAGAVGSAGGAWTVRLWKPYWSGFLPPPPRSVHLLEYRLARGRRSGLFFGRDDGRPFSNQATSQRARRWWLRTCPDPIGLHECRHTFASLMIAAGVNAKSLASFMGHTSISITLDRYGHLFPGNEGEAAALLDAYLEKAKKGVAR